LDGHQSLPPNLESKTMIFETEPSAR